MSDFKAGYLLEITTWENDGDNYNTVKFPGLVRDEVEFYLQVAKLFTSDGCGNGYGNQEETPNEEICEIVANFIVAGKTLPKYWNPAEWREGGTALEEADFSDNLYDLIGVAEDIGYRVFERASVYYLPETLVDLINEF